MKKINLKEARELLKKEGYELELENDEPLKEEYRNIEYDIATILEDSGDDYNEAFEFACNHKEKYLDELVKHIQSNEALTDSIRDKIIAITAEIKENERISYERYLSKWNEDHDEGEPASFLEFLDNEYKDSESREYYNLI